MPIESPTPLNILIVDDHTLFREGLRLLLDRLDVDVSICEAGDIKTAIELGPEAFDLILLDLNLPGISGLDGLVALRKRAPATAVVLLSGVDNPTTMAEGLARGARGFIRKSVSADDMLDSVRRALIGEICIPEASADCMAEAHAAVRLTPRQFDVLMRLCEGASNKEIGRALDMSENTVRSHVAALFQSLGVRTRTEAAAVARRTGIV